MTTPKWDSTETERDVLRARFTVWLDTTLARASARYRDQMEEGKKDNVEVLSYDALPADLFPDPQNPYADIEIGRPDFAFEEERLAYAFAELPLMRREVLRLLFVELRSQKEIAELLHCSEAFVSAEKKRAINKLRQMLEEGSASTYE